MRWSVTCWGGGAKFGATCLVYRYRFGQVVVGGRWTRAVGPPISESVARGGRQPISAKASGGLVRQLARCHALFPAYR